MSLKLLKEHNPVEISEFTSLTISMMKLHSVGESLIH